MSTILILFESGNLAEVRVTLYKAPGERSRLLDAYVTTECEGSVTRSARRAAEAVLSWLPEEYRPKEPMVAGFDFSGLSTDQTITGESGGLAFAIALAAEFTGKDPGSLAATGILADSGSHSEVIPVKAVCAKIKGAIAALPSQSKVLFPLTNQKDCDEEVKVSAEHKEITLEPVASLDQALRSLFGNKQSGPAKPAIKSRTLVAGVAAAIVLLAVLAGIISMREESVAFREGESPKDVVTVSPKTEDLSPDSRNDRPLTSQGAPFKEKPKEEAPSTVEPKIVPTGKGFD